MLLPADLRGSLGPMAPVLARLDPRLQAPPGLSQPEIDALVEFVRNGLLDPSLVRSTCAGSFQSGSRAAERGFASSSLTSVVRISSLTAAA